MALITVEEYRKQVDPCAPKRLRKSPGFAPVPHSAMPVDTIIYARKIKHTCPVYGARLSGAVLGGGWLGGGRGGGIADLKFGCWTSRRAAKTSSPMPIGRTDHPLLAAKI